MNQGKPEDFDNHSLNWIKDKNSEVFFINGLIESYQDPKGVACTFESIVAFKNPEKTAKVNKIIKIFNGFEDNMPVLDIFKKKKQQDYLQVQYQLSVWQRQHLRLYLLESVYQILNGLKRTIWIKISKFIECP